MSYIEISKIMKYRGYFIYEIDHINADNEFELAKINNARRSIRGFIQTLKFFIKELEREGFKVKREIISSKELEYCSSRRFIKTAKLNTYRLTLS